MLFIEIWFDVEVTVKRQHTPKPAAQFPLALPPLLVHSDEVKQVPFRLIPDVVAGPLSDLQGTFLKETTEKRDHTFPCFSS